MELAFVVYLISILENVGDWLLGIALLSGAVIFFIVFISCVIHGTIKQKKTVACLVAISLLCGTLRVMLPSEKQAYTIAAAYGAQAVYQSDGAKEIGNKLLKVINKKLDNMGEDKQK